MEEKKSKRKTGAERKLEILRALVSLISESESKHITTKTLAHRLGISEAALYRHFPGKAEMYREVIKYAENFIVSWINKIVSENASGSDQVRTLYKLLLSLRSAEPGLISLLCGEALALEDKSLQQNINKIYGYIQRLNSRSNWRPPRKKFPLRLMRPSALHFCSPCCLAIG